MPRRGPGKSDPSSVHGLLDDIDDPERRKRRRGRRDAETANDLDLDRIW